MFDNDDAVITSGQFVVSALLYNSGKLSQIIIKHEPKRFVDVTFPVDRLVNTMKVLEGDRIRATLQLLPGGVAAFDRLVCVRASVMSAELRERCHPIINNVDTLRHEEIRVLLDGVTPNKNDLGKRANSLVLSRAKNTGKDCEVSAALPIARSSLHVYNDNAKRAKIPPNMREKQKETMYGYRFVIVGPVDTTLGVCHHAYSSEIGHAVINLEEFPNDNFRPVGTWIIADVVKLVDYDIDPIMWKISHAVLDDFPLDQWGNCVEVASLGPNDDECIMKCRGIVMHLTENKHAVVFSDVLYVMLTADKLKGNSSICGIPLSTLRDHPIVDVLAQFSVSYNGDAWTVIKMESILQADLKSGVLITTDHMKATNKGGKHLIIEGDEFDEHCVFARYICGHRPDEIRLGTSLRTTFAPADTHSHEGWRVVRATAIDRVQGFDVDDYNQCQLPHIPINIENSTDVPSVELEQVQALEAATAIDLAVGEPADSDVVVQILSRQSTKGINGCKSQPVDPTKTSNEHFSCKPEDCDHLRLILQVNKALRSHPEVLVEMTKYDPKLVIDIINYSKNAK